MERVYCFVFENCPFILRYEIEQNPYKIKRPDCIIISIIGEDKL